MNTTNVFTILQMPPMELAQWLESQYLKMIEIPDSEEDFRDNGMLLGVIANEYSFLVSLSSYAKLAVREAKRKKLPKDEIDDCIDRKDIIANYIDITKMRYTAISRMITVHMQELEELHMSDSRYAPNRQTN